MPRIDMHALVDPPYLSSSLDLLGSHLVPVDLVTVELADLHYISVWLCDPETASGKQSQVFCNAMPDQCLFALPDQLFTVPFLLA